MVFGLWWTDAHGPIQSDWGSGQDCTEASHPLVATPRVVVFYVRLFRINRNPSVNQLGFICELPSSPRAILQFNQASFAFSIWRCRLYQLSIIVPRKWHTDHNDQSNFTPTFPREDHRPIGSPSYQPSLFMAHWQSTKPEAVKKACLKNLPYGEES